MNELIQIKENIKESNLFMPDLSFDKNLFGQLYLKEYSRDPFKSKILIRYQPARTLATV